jgi:DNA-binding Lrp family transcriptional regulator
MVSAMVLLNTQIGAEKGVLEKLKTLEGVEEAHTLYSVYDIALKVHANSMNQLKDIITQNIKRTPNVITTLTLLTVDDEQ